MSNALLFTTCILIWGSTWIAITWQLGEVNPVLSVAYRFTLAAIILGLYCRCKKLDMRLPRHIHLKMIAVGLTLYTLEYCLLYFAQQHIISAVVALMSCCIIYINVLLRRLLLNKPIRKEVLVGASLGMLGIALIFYPEFSTINPSQGLIVGIALAMLSFFCASVGNVLSEKILDQGAPVVQMNFWAMCYGLLFMYSYILCADVPLLLPKNNHYYFSLIYLALFGSVLCFGAYMKLVKAIGSDKAAYVVLVYPIIALFMSTLFEGFHWTLLAIVGVCVVLLGNAIAMNKLSLAPIKLIKLNCRQQLR